MREGRGDEEEPCGWRDCLSGTARLLWLLRILIGEIDNQHRYWLTSRSTFGAIHQAGYRNPVTLGQRRNRRSDRISAGNRSSDFGSQRFRKRGAGWRAWFCRSEGCGRQPCQNTKCESTGGHRVSGASSSGPSSPVRAEGWYRGSAPPGWTGHGEQRGGDGRKMPPVLSHRDHDHDHDREWGDRRLSRDAEKGDREHAQLNTGQLERRVDW